VHRPSLSNLSRPGVRAAVLAVCAVAVGATALAVSASVSDHLIRTAKEQVAQTTQALIDGSVAPRVAEGFIGGPNAPDAATIDSDLQRLVGRGPLLRIKVWAPDGTIRYSDLPELVGQRFDVDDDLGEALEGQTSTTIDNASDPENAFERGLATRLLSVYLPLRSSVDGSVVGAFEVYQDAAPIEADVAAASRDVLLIVGALGLALLSLLAAAFAGTARRMALQNRRLRDRARVEAGLLQDLRTSDQRFRSLVRNSVEVQAIVEPDGRLRYVSDAVARVLGRPDVPPSGASLLDDVELRDRPRVLAALHDAAGQPGRELTVEFRARHGDGSWRVLEAVIKNLVDDESVQGLVVNYRDVTTQRELERELRSKAFHDALTGLANRTLFADRLEHAIVRSARGGPRPAVLFIDLDDFKTVNDSLGHGSGDRLLVEVGRRLAAALRPGDTLARMGGDEFAVLVEAVRDVELPVEIARRLLDQLRPPFEHARKEVFVGASVGVAVAGTETATVEELLRSADAAMYVAKTNGKDRVEVYEPRMHEVALRRLALKADLERAIDRGELALVYQPIVDLGSRAVMGAEALLRWNHPTRGLVLPNEFIPLAEETGLIVRLGRWVLEQAAVTATTWGPLGMAPYVTVNVAPRQLLHEGFVGVVVSALRASGLPAERLVLEFTESAFIADAEPIAAMLADLKALGVRLAIDDFGTGFSSLSYVGRLPVDLVKVDRSFVADLRSTRGRAVVAAIVRLADALGLAVIAEGVETPADLAALQELGVQAAQGYLFAKPLAPEAIRSAIRRGTASAGPAPIASRGAGPRRQRPKASIEPVVRPVA
jgi:diguanylate cyclase (GGDEF)-like protein/PAS domain S-box-containing protein